MASDILRTSYTNGIQGDGSYVINPAHTIHAGFTVSGERIARRQFIARRTGTSGRRDDAPETITDNVNKLGWLADVYVQDEWK